jgi:hypothetical protein
MSLAPYRVFRLRNELQFVNSAIEALKKKRNRAYHEYKKSGDKIISLTKDLKLLLKKTEKERIQKATARDPKIFWNMISEIRNGKSASQLI